MDLNTFKRQLQARLSEYNDNEEGYVYYIGSELLGAKPPKMVSWQLSVNISAPSLP